MGSTIRPAFVMLFGLTVLTGLVYPLAVIGIGQNFVKPEYIHPRLSAAGKDGYDASASSGTNLGPTSADLKKAIDDRVAAARADGVTGPIPDDMVTSVSGLDPDISPANAFA